LNKRLVIGVVILVGAVLVFGVGGLIVSTLGPRERGEPQDISFAELDPALWSVRLRGIAHYGPRIRLRSRSPLTGEESVVWAYPMFPLNSPDSKEIRVLVRSTEAPPDRVDIEYVEVEGWLDPIQPATFPFTASQGLERNGYFLSDDAVILESWGQKTLDPADTVP
jgi:hypothetical protein